jgi:hydrogenase maturation protein HypF
LEQLRQALLALPAPILITHIDVRAVTPRRFSAFTIQPSGGQVPEPVVAADLSICPDCLEEMLDKDNRRYHYPYISCAQCGPRYTIMKVLPYDRERTTMSVFAMCPACSREYVTPADRRCYGQTLSCKECGPQLSGQVRGWKEALTGSAALQAALDLLQTGQILAIKSVGGFNLVCRADMQIAVQDLRRLKHRPTKPLAILAATLAQVKTWCQVTAAEAELLVSLPRPIVLLRRKKLPASEGVSPIAPAVALPQGRLGVFLPPQGLYALLARDFPLVVTSCNQSGAPIIFEDAVLEKYYEQHPDVAGFFTYTRTILRPADDSVAQVVAGRTQLLRRARGYMPEPVRVAAPGKSKAVVLAVGAQMEPALALARGKLVYPVAVPGHLEEIATQKHFKFLLQDTSALLGLQPQLVVADQHPFYYTSTLAGQLGIKVLRVQHHHAHALSVMAEHQLQGPVLAVCFDGTGYGSDGTVWGGEFLTCEGLRFQRTAHLAAIPMLGGDQSMRQGWKSALCQLVHAGVMEADLSLVVPEITTASLNLVQAALNQHLNTIANSSMGRLFDAVSALLGICSVNTHQGRGAMELEAWAQQGLEEHLVPLQFNFDFGKDGYDPAPLIRKLAALAISGNKEYGERLRAAAALGFHQAVIAMVLQEAKRSKCHQVALTGGCFANRILLSGCAEALRTAGFAVYFNEQVPPGDGGIVLGQAYYGLLSSL